MKKYISSVDFNIFYLYIVKNTYLIIQLYMRSEKKRKGLKRKMRLIKTTGGFYLIKYIFYILYFIINVTCFKTTLDN